MTIKSILVLADGSAGGERTLATALAVGRQFAAHVDVLHVKVEPEAMVPIVGEGMSGVMVEQMMEAMQKTVAARAARARAAYDRLGPPSGLAVAWREVVGREPEAVASLGRLADLVVVSRPDGEREAPLAATLDAALFDTGRPVMVVSPGTGEAAATPSVGNNIAVAWNGSAQAARAVGAALPLLANARQVTVLSGTDGGKSAPPEELVGYLARHGIKAAAASIELAGAPTGTVLLREAARLQADLLVMGAYGHSRLREMILGGATREVLAAADLPLFIAH